MPPTGATWTRITAASPPRSSHAIAHISGNTYVFSGEHHSRVAVANATLVLPSATTLVADASTPPARVGAAYAASASTFYVHGGRGGASFSALNENGRVWTFNGAGWDHIDPVADGPVPPARSYHAAAVDPAGKMLFVHAGCADDGSRLGDLWCFDIEEKTWRRCADAPGDPRGAPALCVSGERVYRLGGFNGKTEVGGSVDVYDIVTDIWAPSSSSSGSTTPPARSVSALLPVRTGGKEYLLTLFGEGTPSSKGHAGAGKFHDDVWVYDIEAQAWSELDVQGEKPEPRGWFAATGVEGGVVIHGGLGAENERLGDCWLLKF